MGRSSWTVERDLRDAQEHKGVYGDIVWPVGRRVPMEAIEAAVAAEFGMERERLVAHGNRGGVGKKVALELCAQLAGTSQREVGRHFGYVGNGAVGKQRATLRELMKANPRLAENVARLRNRLKNA